MFDELSGKSVLITGASTGIGCGSGPGLRPLRRNGRRPLPSQRRSRRGGGSGRAGPAGAAAAVLQGDITQKVDVRRIIDAHVEEFGRLDVLINNAGDVVRRSAFEQLEDDLIDLVIAVNARSVVTACRVAMPHFLNQGHGNIINTTSLAARQSGGPGSSVYTASKGFAQSLTRFLAREYAPHQIRVNAVAPGLIMTPLQDRNTTSGAARGHDASDPDGPRRPARRLRRRVSVPGDRRALRLHHRRDD